jgi:drug/metabolite transporter (DMT)-like permease
VNSTTERRRTGLPAAANRIWARPARERTVAGQVRSILVRYLALAVVLLGVVAIANPHRPADPAAPSASPWNYQREAIDVQGRGILNLYSRQLMHGTAWLAKASIERQRDVYRLNLFDFLVGTRTAGSLTSWRADHRLALEGATEVVVVALIAYGVMLRPSRRTWALALLLVMASTLLITKPQATARVAAVPGVAIPNLMLDVVATAAPSKRLKSGAPPEQALQALTTQYWTSFVANPLSRVQTGSGVLTGARPGSKASVLDVLRRNVSNVNDWAIGHHGPERAFITTSALGYVLPFAVALGVLAMLATCAQALLFVLCLAGLLALPFAVEGPRRRGALVRYWLLPVLACVVVLALTSLGSFAVMRLAEALHQSDEYVGLLLAGSTWPVVTAALLVRRAIRRRRA